ncbi:MAG: TlpA family protein disulfide reductase [Deltaproteobacteria bacterium]|nr:TlpA family protein disulfide reductase [Deltaproteobacteria bacterium]
MWMRSAAIALLAALLLLPSVPGTAAGEWDIKKQTIEEPAPDFTLVDLAGKEHRLSDYRGKVVLLEFSATWCPYCKGIIPYIHQLQQTYGAKGLVILFIDVMESKKKVKAFVEEYDITYPVLLDEKGKVARQYKVAGIPTLVLIDQNGKIMCRQCRSVDLMLKTLLP